MEEKSNFYVDYIKKKKLYAKEAIQGRGDKYIETRILVPKDDAHTVRRELVQRGAESIITIPITSVTRLNNKNNNS